jgi:peptide/nickel transport system permease protein
MIGFIIRRLFSGFLLLLLILLISIWMIRLIPGSYEELMKEENNPSLENSFAHVLNLPIFYFTIIPDKQVANDLKSMLPIFRWNGFNNEFHQKLTAFASFNFGKSLIDGIDVKNKFRSALPWSLILQIPAIILVLVLSIWIAFRRIRFPGSIPMKAIDNTLVWFHSIPGFWFATILLLLFANPDALHWFPSGLQAVSSNNPLTLWIYYPQYLILPLLCLVLPALAYLVRLVKNGLESSLQKLFWKRALSSGLTFNQALYKEALPVALIPLIAWFAGIFPALISGSLIIEQIFSIPGLGRLMYLSISMRDWPVVQFLFLLGSAMTIIGFIISDVLLRFVDPRINEAK